MKARTILLCTLPLAAGASLHLARPVLAQAPVKAACAPGIEDVATPGDCVRASTIPAAGTLLPLGPELFVSADGRVGLGTMAPEHALDVVGDLRASGRIAIGGDSVIGPDGSGTWDQLFDFSDTISDFSTALYPIGLRSYLTLDPQIDLTGPQARYIYAQDCVVRTSIGNPRDVEYLQGPYMLALHEGTGTIRYMAGGSMGAENNHGHVESVAGAYLFSVADWEATTVENVAVECFSGHYGPSGSITNDYTIYVYAPYTDSPLTNHYGIFLEDQDAGLEDSYAIYSAGGASYFAGDVGIGTDTPSAKLDVAGDFVASGTKSFVQPHPTDPGREIRFVCLEGNEAGTYFRGSAALERGEAVIDVPEEFRLVTEAEGLTVHLTPRGPGADLWVAAEDLARIVVRGARDVEFSYIVHGVRRGYADFEALRERDARASNASRNASEQRRRSRPELPSSLGERRAR